MGFDYQSLIDEAMLEVVKKILIKVHKEGLDKDQSLYLSFRTDFSGVILSKTVKTKYPKEITIVLQHQFKNLAVYDDKFVVNIAFSGIPENIEVPFGAITNFLDPLVNFGFRFVPKNTKTVHKTDDPAKVLAYGSKLISNKVIKEKKECTIVSLDKFRKKIDEKNKII